jgi:TPR repeat protein
VPEAQYNLGVMLMAGEGGPVDTVRAKKLVKAAADQGLPAAVSLLIRWNFFGVGEIFTWRPNVALNCNLHVIVAFFICSFFFLFFPIC